MEAAFCQCLIPGCHPPERVSLATSLSRDLLRWQDWNSSLGHCDPDPLPVLPQLLPLCDSFSLFRRMAGTVGEWKYQASEFLLCVAGLCLV